MIQEVAGGRILKGSVEYTGEDHKKENNQVTLRVARAAKVIGMILGAVGIAGVSVNYPIYKKLLAAGKSKYAFEIMTLAREISEAEA